MNHETFEDQLRSALSAEAARVQPDDGLEIIRARTRPGERSGERPGERRGEWPGTLRSRGGLGGGMARRSGGLMLAAAAVATAILGGAVLAQRADTSAPAPGVATTPTPSVTPSPSPSPTQSDIAPRLPVGPVYWLGDTSNGTKLFREYQPAPQGSASGGSAPWDSMFTTQPADPDYYSLWPAGTRTASVDFGAGAGTATVDLTPAALDRTASEEQTRLSLQQLVHTITATDKSVSTVHLLVDGAPVTDLWGNPGIVPAELTRAPQTDVLAPVWVIDPQEGATVGRSFTFRGAATVYEGTVSWRVRGADGSLVRRGSAQASEGAPGRGVWSVRLTLPAGTYELEAFVVSARDGSVSDVDSKRITVE